MPATPLPDAVARFYTTQSPFSDPGGSAPLYHGLPADPAALARIVRGLFVHRLEGELFETELAPDRVREDAETRYLDEILRLVVERDDSPLTVARPVRDRFVGVCRDFALLHCSLLRHVGVPARIRCGFADYFNDGDGDGDGDGGDHGDHGDHVVTEYWDAERGWLLADTQVIEGHDVPFDPMDVPRDRFLVAGEAWRLIREGKADPRRFGFFGEPPLVGAWFVAGEVRLDLAALNRVETLLWDVWGLGAPSDEEMTEEMFELYDLAASVLASASVADDAAASFDRVRELFTGNAGLRPPAVVDSLALEKGFSQVRLREWA